MTKILLVEDDEPLSLEVARWLEKQDMYYVECCSTGEDGLYRALNYTYDLLVLDWELPDISGVEILRRYRNHRGIAPVLMLTGRSEIEDKEVGFNTGADDYLTKPFHPRELSIRLRTLLRRSPTLSDEEFRYGSVYLNCPLRQLTVGEQSVRLLPLEFNLLHLLMKHPKRIFGIDELLSMVWKSESEATDIAVRTTLSRLRKKLRISGKPDLIENIHGLGYKLNPPES